MAKHPQGWSPFPRAGTVLSFSTFSSVRALVWGGALCCGLSRTSSGRGAVLVWVTATICLTTLFGRLNLYLLCQVGDRMWLFGMVGGFMSVNRNLSTRHQDHGVQFPHSSSPFSRIIYMGRNQFKLGCTSGTLEKEEWKRDCSPATLTLLC